MSGLSPRGAAPAIDDAEERARLDRLFRMEAPRLLGFFRRRTRDSELAMDMVQEAFLRLAGSSTGRRLDNPAPYLQRIARNLLFDRNRRRETTLLHLPFNDDCSGAVEPEQIANLEASDMLKLYRRALSELSPRTREVFLLHRVDGLTYNDIRLRLDVSLGTVEYHISRALVHIDRVLGEA
jgi:RNA polymerase sigma-70 factor (ECF subfamily)